MSLFYRVLSAMINIYWRGGNLCRVFRTLLTGNQNIEEANYEKMCNCTFKCTRVLAPQSTTAPPTLSHLNTLCAEELSCRRIFFSQSFFKCAIPGLFYSLFFVFSTSNIKFGLEPKTSVIGSDRSANWATLTTQLQPILWRTLRL